MARPRSILRLVTILLLLGPNMTVSVFAQATEEKDPQLKEAERRKALAEAQQAIAEAKLAELKARIGELGITPPEGNITLGDNIQIEAIILAYRATRSVAEQIANEIKTKVTDGQAGTVVIFGSEIASTGLYKAYTEQLAILESQKPPARLPSLNSDNIPANGECAELTKEMLPLPPLTIIGGAVQLLSLFRSDVSIHGVQITPDKQALVALVVAGLLPNITVIYPEFFPADSFKEKDVPAIYDKINKLQQARVEAANVLLPLILNKKEDLSGKLEKEKRDSCKRIYRLDLRELDVLKSRIDTFSSNVDAMVAELLKADGQSGAKLLQTLGKAEKLLKAAGEKAYVLDLKFVSAGGGNKTKKGTFGSSLSFSGGVVVSYILMAPDGKIVLAGVLDSYGGYVREEELNKCLGGVLCAKKSDK